MGSMSGQRAISPGEGSAREQMTHTTVYLSNERGASESHHSLDAKDSGDGEEGSQSSTALILSPMIQEEPDEDPNDPDTAEIMEIERSINVTLDKTFDDSARYIAVDMMSVSRKVLQFAEEILQASTQPPTQNKMANYSQSSAARTTAEEFLSVPQALGPSSEHGNPGSPIYPAPGNAETNTSHTRDRSIHREASPLSSLDHAPDPADTEFLIFKNVDGKSHQFPYNAVRNWDVSSVRSPEAIRADFDRMHNLCGCH